ncbi:CHASE2 domain-containing protein [Phormidesmis sp. 146-35]
MWKQLRYKVWQWRIVIAIAPSVAGLVMLIRYSGSLQPLEWWSLDQLFCLRPVESPESRIVVVEVQEADLRKVKKWPMSDTMLADLLTKIRQQTPAAIGLDLYRDLPVEPGHQQLNQIFQTTPNLIGIKKAISDGKGAAIDPPPKLKELDQVAANDVIVDSDGKIRRGILYLTDQNDNNVMSLPLMLAAIYLEQKNKPLTVSEQEQIKFGEAVLPAFRENDGGYVRSDDGGYQILLNYRGTQSSFLRVSMSDVLANKIPTNLLRDRIVLIGPVAESLRDVFYTPYSNDLRNIAKLPPQMPGVYYHANLTSQLLSTALDDRPLIKTWGKSIELLWILVWSIVGTAGSWLLRPTGQVRHPLQIVGRRSLIPLAAVGSIGTAYAAFLMGWWLPLVPGLLALGGSTLAVTAYFAQLSARIRSTFGRYLTEQVVTSLLETPDGLKFGGDRRKVTILMSDIRGFSAISERCPPEKVVHFLNIYLEVMADVITQYGGTIDEFIGDGILVIFGALQPSEDDAHRAIACAIAMQLAMNQINQQIQSLDIPNLETGIGINTGEVVVGNIGSIKRAKYGVVGSNVNLTGRIESYTVGGQILISESTLHEVGAIVRIDGQIPIQPKGFQEPIMIYDIGGIGEPFNLFLPKTGQVFHELTAPIPIQFFVLDGKHISGSQLSGWITKLSPKQAELKTEQPIPLLSNLKITLAAAPGEDLYIKIVEQAIADQPCYHGYFTSIPAATKQILSTFISPSIQ